MPLSREQIQRLRDARGKVGSVQLLRSYVNTHAVDEEQIMGMIRNLGADGAFDRIFGLAPARQVRQPEMATIATQPVRPSPEVGAAAGVQAAIPAQPLPRTVPERPSAEVPVTVPTGKMTVPLERDKELAVRQAGVGVPPTVQEDRFPRRDTPTQSDRSLWLGHKLKEANIPLDLLLALVKAESNFDPSAKSRVGALGLMQLMPKTAQQMNLKVEKGNDQRSMPLLNINAGIDYLVWLKQHFKPKSTEELLAAYNAGPSRLKGGRYKKYPETRAYIKKIRDQIARYKSNPSERSADAQKLYNVLMK